MADQTQRLEVATVRAEVGSSILYRFSNDAVDAAAIPTESGNINNLKKVILDIQTEGAEKISFATTIYPTTAAGLAATTNGAIFLVRSSDPDEIYAVYSNNAGTAVDTGKRAISGAAVTAAVNTATTAAANAQTAADTATARVAGFHSPSASDPTTRDDGTSLQIGDTYFNTTLQSNRIFTSSGWAQQALDSNYLSADEGASRIGAENGSTVQDNLDLLTNSVNNAIPGSAAKLTTARTISLTGDVTGSVSFDGSGNVSTTATLASNGLKILGQVTPAANKLPYFSATGTATTTDIVALGRTIIGTSNTQTIRTAIQAATVGANADITSLTGLTTPLSAAQGGTGGNLASTTGSSLVGFIGGLTGAQARLLQDKLRDLVSAKDFGATGDGSTSEVTAFGRANTAGSPIIITPGSYLVGASFTFTVPVTVLPGAVFLVPTGVTLTFNEAFSAGIGRVFTCTGTGAVAFAASKTSVGYPEWWGATTNLGTDATAAIQACFVALPITQLQAADYYVATNLSLNTNGRSLIGKGCEWYGVAGQATRIISNTGSSNVIHLGPDSAPSSINDFPRGMKIKDLQVTRAVAPVIASTCIGILNRYTLFATMENVKSAESMYGFQYVGCVQTRTESCQAFRSIAGTGSGTDTFRGFHYNGSVVLPGVSGGNASMHFNSCVASAPLISITTYGAYVNGNWADTWFNDFETTACAVGIYLQGDTNSTLNYGTTDLHINNPILDQFRFAGIFIDGTGPYCNIGIVGGFEASAAGVSGAVGCIYANNSLGSISISGGNKMVCGTNTAMTGGFVGISSQNIDSIGNIIQESSSYPIILNGCSNCKFDDRVTNYSRTASAAYQLTSSSRNQIKVAANGKAGGFAIGAQLSGAANANNELNVTGLNTAAISGAKVQINGATISATGLSGSNLISGVIA